MPFEKDNQLSKGVSRGKTGRKGYSFEKKQLVEMRKLLSDFLKLARRIMDEEETEKDIKKLQLLERMTLKILDKIHTTKSDVTTDTEKMNLGVIILPERDID